ncbi:MAG TPA: N-acetyltransferase [Actinocrinis sp.]|nr:N-acetyltransferase [Actinocrinis sp.]
MTMTNVPIVPADFAVPAGTSAGGLRRLELLGPQHNEADHAAWTSSVEHIRATAGWAGRDWPVAAMTPAENLADLVSHQDRSARRLDFAYTVIEEATGETVGCVYFKPARTGGDPVQALSWVRADRAALDGPLTRIVGAWLAAHWPFEAIGYRDGDTPTTIRAAAAA